MLFKLKARTLWLITLVLFLLGIGFVVLAIYSPTGSNTVFIVCMTIDLILLTFSFQWAIQKSIKYKPKPVKYETKDYTKTLDFDEALKNNKFDLRNRNYGRSYIKIEGKNAYKVTVVVDSESYFDNSEENENTANPLAKKLDKCDTFTGLEIFVNPSDEVKTKIADFTIQGERVYYTALLKTEEDIYHCANYEKPSEKHEPNLKYVFELLGLKEISDTVQNGTND